jgi:hypothetical protein
VGHRGSDEGSYCRSTGVRGNPDSDRHGAGEMFGDGHAELSTTGIYHHPSPMSATGLIP